MERLDSSCDCALSPNEGDFREPVVFHQDKQNRDSYAWKALLFTIEEAVKDQREKFAPREFLGEDLWKQIVALPKEIATLEHVKILNLYGSYLTYIPPEISGMKSLKRFFPYTSYSLHWFPYEITRCLKLCSSGVSTRVLYGNYKYRMQFPDLCTQQFLYDDEVKCSICDKELSHDQVDQYWISRMVGSDVLPLLANICSQGCFDLILKPEKGYIQFPHKGGPNLEQPAPRYG